MIWKQWFIPDGFNFDEWTSATAIYSHYMDPPEKPGVYVVIFKERIADPEEYYLKIHILYIGRSTNLLKRFKSHNLYGRLKKKYGNAEFLFKQCRNYISEERRLIKLFNPKYNIRHNKNSNPQNELKRYKNG